MNKPVNHQISDLTLLPDTITRLDNGITLHHINAGDAPVCQLTLLLPTGSLDYDNPSVPSIMADLLTEGTVENSGEQIADILDYNGAWVRAIADQRHITVTLSCTVDRLKHVLPTFIECISKSVFPEQSLDMLRQRAAYNRSLALEKVSTLSSEAALILACGQNSRLARCPNPDDILMVDRDNLLQCQSNALNPQCIHVFFSGCFDDSVMNFVGEKLNEIEGRSHHQSANRLPFDSSAPCTVHIDVPHSIQSSMSIAIPTILRSHPDYIPLRIAVTALGGYFGSRLMMNIREDKGYTYGISASLNGSIDGSYIDISAQYDPSYQTELLNQVKIELQRLADQPISETELKHLKMYMFTRQAASVDSVFGMMQQYLLRYTVGVPENYFSDQLKTIKEITPDIIQSMARKYMQPIQLRIAIAGK